jgi:hypothetical protein
MRSNLVLGVAAVALSLGINGALADPPTFNFQARTAPDLKSLSPARNSSSVQDLSRITNTTNITSQKGFTALPAASAQTNLAAHVADLRAVRMANLTARFGSSQGVAESRQGAFNAVRQSTSSGRKAMTSLKHSAALPKSTSPIVRKLALAAGKPQSHSSGKLLPSLSPSLSSVSAH